MMKTLFFLCATFLFTSDNVLAFDDSDGDVCDRMVANKTLDLFFLGFNNNNILLVTSKKTGYLVYEEPHSSWDPATHKWNLKGKPVPMKEKWPVMFNSELFKILEAKDPVSPAGKVFPFTAVNDEAKNFLVLYNKDDPAMYDFADSKMIKIKSTENRWTSEMEGFISTTDQKNSYEISLGYNGTTDKMMLNRSFAFISSGDEVQDVFQGDQNTFHICMPSSTSLQYEKDVNCENSVAWAPMKALKVTFSDSLKYFYLFGPTVIIYYQEDYSHAVPYQTKSPKDFFICPPKYYTTTKNPNDPDNPSHHNGTSGTKVGLLIFGILLIILLIILCCFLIYCFCFADKKDEKKKKEKEKKKKDKTPKKKTKTPKKKTTKTARADKTQSGKKSGTSSSGSPSDGQAGKVKKSAFAGKVGLLAKKTGMLGKESQATVFDPSNVTLRSAMVAKSKKKLLKSKGKMGSAVSGVDVSRVTLRSKASAQKKVKSRTGKSLGKSVRSSSSKAKGGSSNVSNLAANNQSSALSKADDKPTSFASRKESDISTLKVTGATAGKVGKVSNKSKKMAN